MIAVIIAGIRGEAIAYLTSKFLVAGLEPSSLTPTLLKAIGSMAKRRVPILETLDLSAFSSDSDRQMDPFNDQLRSLADQQFPLITGEVIVKDIFSFLKEPFEELESGTCVLQRRTNRANQTIFFPGYRIDDGFGIHQQSITTIARRSLINPPSTDLPLVEWGSDAREAKTLSLAARLGQGLVRGYGGRRACSFFPALLGTRPIDLFDCFYRDMTRVIGHRFPAQTQVWLGDEIDHFLGFCQVLARTSKDLNQSGMGATEGIDTALREHEQRLMDTIELWQGAPAKNAALGWVGFAVCSQLALLQEAAYRDQRVRQPWRSHHATRLSQLANNYADLIERQVQTLITQRLNRVQTRHTHHIFARKSYGLLMKGVRWVDEAHGRLGPNHLFETSTSSGSRSCPQDLVNTQRDRYKETLTGHFERTLSPLHSLTRSLRYLAGNPLPEPIASRSEYL